MGRTVRLPLPSTRFHLVEIVHSEDSYDLKEWNEEQNHIDLLRLRNTASLGMKKLRHSAALKAIVSE